MREISIDMTSGIPMVDIMIWSRIKNGYQSISLVIDTGATVTVISPDILDALGYVPCSKNKKRVTTASGTEHVDEAVLDKIMIAGLELEDVGVHSLMFPKESFSKGVIGVNVLSEFDMFISLQNKVLKLMPVNKNV